MPLPICLWLVEILLDIPVTNSIGYVTAITGSEDAVVRRSANNGVAPGMIVIAVHHEEQELVEWLPPFSW